MNMFDPGFIELNKPLASGHPFLALFSAMIAEAIPMQSLLYVLY